MTERASTRPATGGIARELDLRSSPFAAAESQIKSLVPVSRYRELPPGTRIFVQGATSARIYIVVDGEVDLSGKGETWHATSGATIGVLDAMIGRPYARTATTTTHVRLLELDAADFDEHLQENIDVVHNMIAEFAGDIVSGALASSNPGIHLGMTSRDERGRCSTERIGDQLGELSLVERLLLFRRVPVLATASVQAIANLAQSARQVRLAPDEVLARAGTSSDVISVLVRGRILLTHPSFPEGLVNDSIDFASRLDELAAGPRALTATAMIETDVLQIHREELIDRFDEHFELVRSFFKHHALEQERYNDDLARRGLPL